MPAGNQLVVQLDLTLDGTLKVSAREKATGLLKQITIENAIARFAVEERAVGPGPARPHVGRPRLGAEGEAGRPGTSRDARVRRAVPVPPACRRSTPARARGSGRRSRRGRCSTRPSGSGRRRPPRTRPNSTGWPSGCGRPSPTAAWPDLSAASNELSDVLFYLEDA